jgi:hypothetical protein
VSIDIRIIATIAYLVIMVIQNNKGGGAYDFFTPMAMMFWTLLYAAFWIFWLIFN